MNDKKEEKPVEPEEPVKIRDPDDIYETPAASVFKKLINAGMPSGKFELRKGYGMTYLGYGPFMLDYPDSPQNIELTDHLIMCANRHFGWCELSFETLERRINSIAKKGGEQCQSSVRSRSGT